MKQQNCLIYFLILGVLFFFDCTKKEETNLNNTIFEVKVEAVKTFNGGQTFSYSGTIEESESMPLSFSNVGIVSKVLVSEGDYVKRGQLLAELNSESFKSIYEMSEATQKQAQDAYDRLFPMYKNGNLPEIKFVEIETGLQKAKAAAAIAKKSLDDCKLYSPTNGIVGTRSVEQGMSALPNVVSINIIKIEKVFARVSISESEISYVKKGDKAKIKITALNNTEFSGIVEEIGVIADPIAHTYKVKIGINNKDKKIKPGMICNVTLEKVDNDNKIVVPTRAVMVNEKGENYVYTVNSSQNKAERKYVQAGELLNGEIEIISGLNSDDVVVVSGQHKLFDGALVHFSKEN